GFETYSPKETDFRTVVDKLVGLYYQDARKREMEALVQLREQEGITRETHRTEKYFHLPPIVDFDAVFIPDVARVVANILPTFAYRDVENVQFLGVATWNSPDLLKRAQRYAENSAFVDIFHVNSPSPEV